MTLKPGWLKRQLNRSTEDIIKWPAWLRKEAEFYDKVIEPYYALPVATDEEINRIAMRLITASIRPGWRRGYELGSTLFLCCEWGNWAIRTQIACRRYCTFAELTNMELSCAGADTLDELRAKLKPYYHADKLQLNSQVTVVQWMTTSGKLVEQAKKDTPLWDTQPMS